MKGAGPNAAAIVASKQQPLLNSTSPVETSELITAANDRILPA
jgi:hypothetical protein